jgi:hypothetical protein
VRTAHSALLTGRHSDGGATPPHRRRRHRVACRRRCRRPTSTPSSSPARLTPRSCCSASWRTAQWGCPTSTCGTTRCRCCGRSWAPMRACCKR